MNREEKRLASLNKLWNQSKPGPLELTLPVLRLELNLDVEEANRELRRLAAWFDLPHPTGRDLRGECDFIAIRLALVLARYPEKLEPETREAIRRFFATFDFSSIYFSENHLLLFLTARHIAGILLPDLEFAAYGKKGRALAAEDIASILYFLSFRARRGWGEFDSCGYVVAVWECLTLLYDYSDSFELRSYCEKTMNILLASILQETVEGCHAGAHGRIYPASALDYAECGTGFLAWYYAGAGTLERMNRVVFEPLISSYRPPPEIMAMAEWKPERPVEIRSRKHLHNICDVLPEHPLAGSLCKYSFRSPHFLLGCVVHQDDYPDAESRHYAFHQQHDWDLFLSGGSTRRRIFTHHPGDFGEHNEWTGDLGCRCGSFFQHRGIVMALYEIPPEQPMQYIHAFLPRAEFVSVIEEEGVVFIATEAACAALIILNKWYWESETEIRSPGSRNVVVCEAAELSECGSFEVFRRDVLGRKPEFDREKRILRYGRIELHGDGTRKVDGVVQTFDWPLYESPLIRSEWDSGEYTLFPPDVSRFEIDVPVLPVPPVCRPDRERNSVESQPRTR